MTAREVAGELAARGLRCLATRYYEPLALPGMGWLPPGFRERLQDATYRRPRLQVLGVEALLLLSRPVAG
jgi:hypothetical protein